MLIQNERVLLEIADNSGAWIRLRDKARGMEFIQTPPEAAFRVTVPKSPRRVKTLSCLAFSIEAGSDALSLVWKLEQGVTLRAWIALLSDGVRCTSGAECDGETEIVLVEYPVIGGMGAWGDRCEMIHSFATGLLVKNPLDCFKPGEGVRYAPYPESFSGASMQFYAYYCLGKGGLCFMAEDGQAHQKWLNLYRNGNGMEATLLYGYEDMGPGKPVRAPYPFTVRFLEGHGWWEAAGVYKAWAVEQSWCAMGPVALREHCRWLMERVGLTTFGINAGKDRSDYIRRYRRDLGVPIFHVLGPDWTNTPQTFGGPNPGGLADWVPTRFHTKTLEAIRAVGDYFAPFEFDMMAIPDKADAKEVAENRHQFPAPPHTYSCDRYHFHMLCPCQPYTHQLHVRRDEQVTREADVDAMYYDISANNLLHVCLSSDHEHPIGGGNVLTAGYKRLYRDTKAACAHIKGDYFPIGTEMMNEVFLPELDYYQARAGAQPCSALEMWPYKKLIDQGDAELIPLFAYVYHEYGAVRMDGWGKLVEEVGDLFYDAAAKIYLWGGLYELNYEYSPAEALDGRETRGDEHYYEFASFGYEYSSGRARYLRQFAALRTGKGNRYLAYGQMLPPPQLAVPEREKRYYHYNHGSQEIFGGSIKLPAVRAATWKSRGADRDTYALFFVNTDLEEQRIALSLRPEDYPDAAEVRLYTAFDSDHSPESSGMGRIPADGALSLALTLPSRKVVMLELT